VHPFTATWNALLPDDATSGRPAIASLGLSTTDRPFGATESADWPLPALALASIASALLEPDPAIAWDAERIARVRQTLNDLAAAGIHSQG
jgi:hypothetical protein